MVEDSVLIWGHQLISFGPRLIWEGSQKSAHVPGHVGQKGCWGCAHCTEIPGNEDSSKASQCHLLLNSMRCLELLSGQIQFYF